MAKIKSELKLSIPARTVAFDFEEMFPKMWLGNQLAVKQAKAFAIPITVVPSKDGKTFFVSNETLLAIDEAMFE